MKIKTAELIGPALDWAVAKCEWYREEGDWRGLYIADYSTDWVQGGPIIEREKIGLDPFGETWIAHPSYRPIQPNVSGPTPLISAMRCYVASKLGDEVDVPEELL